MADITGLTVHGGGASISYAPDNQSLITGGDGGIGRWDLSTYKPKLCQNLHTRPITWVTVSPDGEKVATSSRDGTVRLWDLSSGNCLKSISMDPEKEAYAWCVEFAPDGRTLASGNFLQGISLWDATSTRLLRRFQVGDIHQFMTVAFSGDGKTLCCGSWGDPALHLIDLGSGAVNDLPLSDGTRTCSVALSRDCRTLASGGSNLHLWEGRSGRLLHCKSDETGSVALSPDGLLCATSVGVQLWEAHSGVKLATWGDERAGFEGRAPLAFSRDGRLLAATTRDRVRLWDLATGKELHFPQGSRSKPTSLAISPNNKRLVTGYDDATSLVWDLSHLVHSLDEMTADEAQVLWKALLDRDCLHAYQALQRLQGSPDQMIVMLRSELRPDSAAEQRRVERLIQDLSSPQFSIREHATEELETLVWTAEKSLRRELDKPGSLEARRRLERLLDRWAFSPRLRRLRWAITVLELSDRAAAQQLLESLASGHDSSSLTEEAKAALRRKRACDKDGDAKRP